MVVFGIRNRKGIKMRWVTMQDSLYIRTFAKEIHIHWCLSRWFDCALDCIPGQVNENHIIATYIPLIMLGRGDKDDIILKFPRQVPPMPSYILMSSQMMAYSNKGINFIRMFF